MIFFFRRDRTKEADFLIHKAGHFELPDAKWTEHPETRDAAALARVAKELPPDSIKRSALICRGHNPYPVRDRIQAVSAGAC